ncbi:DNA polymerase II [Thalassotalea sp. PP2-459]|uniref:DNA polymerase II n=1 Tax=Thalassotalea sp. PP2-459 TaxID=1742724 RepID=UPI000AEF8EAF|nr:DNA polymerase II [Thalassotalea sp. PP2-459]
MLQSCETIKGFILTRQAYDSQAGIVLSYWVKSKDGVSCINIYDEQALFFIENENVDKSLALLKAAAITVNKITPLTLKTFQQQQVTGFYFNSMQHFYRAREVLLNHDIKRYEDDIRPDERYLMERFITANVEFICQSSIDEQLGSPPVFTGVKARSLVEGKLRFPVSFSVVSLDIECTLKGELFSIGLYLESDQQESVKTILMIGENTGCYSNKLSTDEANHIYPQIVWCANEKALLQALIRWFHEYDPDIVIGWNVINFDFQILQQRFDLYRLTFSIGRDGKQPRWRKNRASEQLFIDINGRVIIDGIDLLRTATYSFSSFSLDSVATELLGVGKKVEDVENRVAEIIDNFHHDKLALAAYNMQDCALVLQIFEHTDLLSFAKLRAELTGLSIDRIGGSVAAFTNLYLPKLHRAGYIAPNLGDGMKGLVSPGGFVMNSIPGLYKNVLVLDFKSLYPSIIRTFNIDPMGMVEGLLDIDHSIEGFDGAYFSRDKHFLPDIIEELWSERDKAKAEHNDALSQAIKIIMNSFYGILGSTGCRFFDPRLASSITKRGHELLKTTKRWIEQRGFQVIYGDTDSIFVSVPDDLDQAACKVKGDELADLINQRWQEELTRKYKITSQLEIEFETHFIKFFMPTIRGQEVGTKKRYAGIVNKKGTENIIFKGLESVRSDWTPLAKQFQKSLYSKVFNDKPVIDYVRSIVQQTLKGELDHLLVYRKRIRRKLHLYVKNVPPHIKAARAADEINSQQGRALRFQNKGWVEYVLTTSGPQVVGYVNAPMDYQLYIDRQLAAVADAILPFIGESFDQIVAPQQSLF